MPDNKNGIVSGGGTSIGDSDSADSSIVSGAGSQLSSKEDHTMQSYTVVKGDSLSKIAQRVYGKASLWEKIYEENRDHIKDPDLIYPGQVLRLPEI